MYIIVLVSLRGPIAIYFKKSLLIGATNASAGKSKKMPKANFCFSTVPKYITTWLIWVDLFILYEYSRIGVTQRPHDHLFQKSRLIGATCASAKKSEKSPKASFCFPTVPKYHTTCLIWVDLFITYACRRNGITQRPHDHLFRKSGQLCETKASAGKSKNSPKSVFALLVSPNTLPLG